MKNLIMTQEKQDRIWDYHQIDDISQFNMSYSRLLFLASFFIKGQRVLNIGVGSGYLEERLLDRGVDVYALDPSEGTIEKLQTRLALGNRARPGYGHNIPFEDNYFDGVVMTEVLEHLTDDVLNRTLKEVYRTLKDDGIFLGTVPYKENLHLNQAYCPTCQNVFHRWGHHQSFDTKRMFALLKQHDFHVLKVQARAFPDWHRTSVKGIARSLGRYILGRLGEPIVGPCLYFRAKKGN